MADKLRVADNGIVWGKAKADDRPNPKHVRICEELLSKAERTKTGRVGSYFLKHIIEQRAGWPQAYVTNGACIQAAINLGIVVTPLEWGNPNAMIGISRVWLKKTRLSTERQIYWASWRSPFPAALLGLLQNLEY